jgi:hypothetical protein
MGCRLKFETPATITAGTAPLKIETRNAVTANAELFLIETTPGIAADFPVESEWTTASILATVNTGITVIVTPASSITFNPSAASFSAPVAHGTKFGVLSVLPAGWNGTHSFSPGSNDNTWFCPWYQPSSSCRQCSANHNAELHRCLKRFARGGFFKYLDCSYEYIVRWKYPDRSVQQQLGGHRRRLDVWANGTAGGAIRYLLEQQLANGLGAEMEVTSGGQLHVYNSGYPDASESWWLWTGSGWTQTAAP